jgi:hypothetical protein
VRFRADGDVVAADPRVIAERMNVRRSASRDERKRGIVGKTFVKKPDDG